MSVKCWPQGCKQTVAEFFSTQLGERSECQVDGDQSDQPSSCCVGYWSAVVRKGEGRQSIASAYQGTVSAEPSSPNHLTGFDGPKPGSETGPRFGSDKLTGSDGLNSRSNSVNSWLNMADWDSGKGINGCIRRVITSGWKGFANLQGVWEIIQLDRSISKLRGRRVLILIRK